MDTDNIQPGHALDALVAEKVMGWKPCYGSNLHMIGSLCGCGKHPNRTHGQNHPLWSPSTDIAAAWEVAKHLARNGGTVQLTNDRIPEGWYCVFAGSVSGWATEATPELAICVAALKARGA